MIMMVLGGYFFSIETSAYQELVHARSWQWVENEVIEDAPDLQFTGAKPEVITLKGTMFPAFKGGALQMTGLSLLAGRGVPVLLVSGLGLVMGFWVIEAIEENKFNFTTYGQPQKIEFSISLKKFGNMKKAIAALLANPLSAIGVSDPSSLNPANMSLGTFGL